MQKSIHVHGFRVAQHAGTINGRTQFMKHSILVGARTEKEAIAMCQQQIDPTGQFTIIRKETAPITRLGAVIVLHKPNQPFIQCAA